METRDPPQGVAAGALCLAGLLAALPACHSQESEWPERDPTHHAPAAVAAPPAPHTPPARAPTLRQPRGRLADECARRRRELAAKVGGPAVIWVAAAPENDLDRFYQSDDFYYLTGVEIPDVGLALHVDASGQLADEVLFLPPHDPQFET